MWSKDLNIQKWFQYKTSLLTVDAGAATFLIVIFLGSEAREETATGIAVAYSIPPAAETVVNWLNPSSPWVKPAGP